MPPLGPVQFAKPRAPRHGPVDPDADLYVWDHCSWSEVVIATQGTLPAPEARIRLCTPPRSPEPQPADNTDEAAKTATIQLPDAQQTDAQRTETLLNGSLTSKQTLAPATLSRQTSLSRSQSREPRGKGLDLQYKGAEPPTNLLGARPDQSTSGPLKRPRAHEPEMQAELANSPVPTARISHSAKKIKETSALHETSTSQPNKTPLRTMMVSQRSSPNAGLPQTSLQQTSLPQTSLPQTGLQQTGLPQTKAPPSKALQSRTSQSKSSRRGPSQPKAPQIKPSLAEALRNERLHDGFLRCAPSYARAPQIKTWQPKNLRAAPVQTKTQQTKTQETKTREARTQETKAQESSSTSLPLSAAKVDRLLANTTLSRMNRAYWNKGQDVEESYDEESLHISSILSPEELDRQRYKESAYVTCPIRFQDRLPWKWRELSLKNKAPWHAPISPRDVMEAIKKAATNVHAGTVVINTPDVGCYEWQIRFESERMASHWIGRQICIGPGIDMRLEPFSLHYVARIGPLINGRNLDRVVDAVSRCPDVKGAEFWLGVPGHEDTMFDRALVVFRIPPRLPQFKTVVRGLGEHPEGFEVIFQQINRDNQLCECCDEPGHNARFCEKVRPVQVDQGGRLLLKDRPWLVADGKDVVPLGAHPDGEPRYLHPVPRLTPWRNYTKDL